MSIQLGIYSSLIYYLQSRKLEHKTAEIIKTAIFDSKQKATIFAQLDYRFSSANSIKSLSETILEITNNLINEIESYLE